MNVFVNLFFQSVGYSKTTIFLSKERCLSATPVYSLSNADSNMCTKVSILTNPAHHSYGLEGWVVTPINKDDLYPKDFYDNKLQVSKKDLDKPLNLFFSSKMMINIELRLADKYYTNKLMELEAEIEAEFKKQNYNTGIQKLYSYLTKNPDIKNKFFNAVALWAYGKYLPLRILNQNKKVDIDLTKSQETLMSIAITAYFKSNEKPLWEQMRIVPRSLLTVKSQKKEEGYFYRILNFFKTNDIKYYTYTKDKIEYYESLNDTYMIEDLVDPENLTKSINLIKERLDTIEYTNPKIEETAIYHQFYSIYIELHEKNYLDIVF